MNFEIVKFAKLNCADYLQRGARLIRSLFSDGREQMSSSSLPQNILAYFPHGVSILLMAAVLMIVFGLIFTFPFNWRLRKKMMERNELLREAAFDLAGQFDFETRKATNFFRSTIEFFTPTRIKNHNEKKDPKFADIRLDIDIKKIDFSNRLELASVHMFVEKAQAHLGNQAYIYNCLAIFLILLSILIACAGFSFVYLNEISSTHTTHIIDSWAYTMVYIIRTATLVGFFATVLYLCVSLSRAFLHEATQRHKQIHALRFGRLYMYLKILGLPESLKNKIKTDLDIKDLERAFGWNLEAPSAFKDINPEIVTNTLVSKLIDAQERIIVAAVGKKE